MRRFLQATARGHRRLREDPDAGLDPLLEASPELDRGLQAAVVRATLPVFFPESEERPFGYQDRAEWQAYADWMRRNGLIERDIPGSAAATNEFLPGQGLDPDVAGTR